MKTLFQSRTFWVAVAQGIVGVLTVVFTELDMAAYVVILKSFVDILLRLDTKTEIY